MRCRPLYKKAEQIWIKVNKGIFRTSHDNGSIDGHQLFGKHSKNMTILVALLVVYSRIYNKTRATFTFGLALFACMSMLHNRIAVYGYFAMAPLYSIELLPYFAGIHIAELIGLIALLKVTVWPEELKTSKAAL